LRIYDISFDKAFQLRSQIESGITKGILSAMIFDDQKKKKVQGIELDESAKNDEQDELSRCYIVITFNENSTPLFATCPRINEAKWELFRKIENPTNKY